MNSTHLPRPTRPRPQGDGRAGHRRAPALGRPRPAVPHRVLRDAAGAADDAGRAARRRSDARRSPAGGAAGRRAARRVHHGAVAGVRRSSRARRRLCGAASTVAVGDQMWARFLVELLPHLPGASFRRAVDVVGPLRKVKDDAEIAALRAAGEAADRVAAAATGRRDPTRRAHRGAGVRRPLGPAARRRPRQGQLRHRRRRGERRQPAPSRVRAG